MAEAEAEAEAKAEAKAEAVVVMRQKTGRGGDVGMAAAAGPGMYGWMDATVVSKYIVPPTAGRADDDGLMVQQAAPTQGERRSRRGGSGTREQIRASSWWNDQVAVR